MTAHRRLRALDPALPVHQDVVAGQQIDMLGRAQDVEAMHAEDRELHRPRPALLGATSPAPRSER
ncbi:MAG: hypothetical protein R3B70_40800 [Polyangiaceae bacterium]